MKKKIKTYNFQKKNGLFFGLETNPFGVYVEPNFAVADATPVFLHLYRFNRWIKAEKLRKLIQIDERCKYAEVSFVGNKIACRIETLKENDIFTATESENRLRNIKMVV